MPRHWQQVMDITGSLGSLSAGVVLAVHGCLSLDLDSYERYEDRLKLQASIGH